MVFVHFQDDGQNPKVVIDRHLEHSHRHRLIRPNKTEVSITVIQRDKQSFQPRQSQRKCPHINATLTDNRT